MPETDANTDENELERNRERFQKTLFEGLDQAIPEANEKPLDFTVS